jgi:hypothetical protein
MPEYVTPGAEFKAGTSDGYGRYTLGGGTPERTLNMSNKDQVQTRAVIRKTRRHE